MKIVYDSYADALSITFKEGKVKKTLEIAPEILLDVDSKSKPLYLEILGVQETIPLVKLIGEVKKRLKG